MGKGKENHLNQRAPHQLHIWSKQYGHDKKAYGSSTSLHDNTILFI